MQTLGHAVEIGGLVRPTANFFEIDPADFTAPDGHAEPRISYDIALGQDFEYLNIPTDFIGIWEQQKGYTPEQIVQRSIFVTAATGEKGKETQFGKHTAATGKTTINAGSAVALAKELREEGMAEDEITTLVTGRLSATVSHEERHHDQAVLTDKPDVKEVLEAQRKFERRVAALRTSPEFVASLGAAATLSAVSYELMKSDYGIFNEIGAVIGVTTVIGFAYLAKILKERYQDFKHRVQRQEIAYRNQPIEQDARAYGAVYRDLVTERGLPSLFDAKLRVPAQAADSRS
jgi:hypothetical protein